MQMVGFVPRREGEEKAGTKWRTRKHRRAPPELGELHALYPPAQTPLISAPGSIVAIDSAAERCTVVGRGVVEEFWVLRG